MAKKMEVPADSAIEETGKEVDDNLDTVSSSSGTVLANADEPQDIPMFDGDNISVISTQPQGDPPKKRGRKPGGKNQAPVAENPTQQIVIPPEASAAAAKMIVSSMDMLLGAISDNQYTAPEDHCRNYCKAWENYLATFEKQPPAWLMVGFMTVTYSLPAFSTQAGKGKMATMASKAKGWWASRFG